MLGRGKTASLKRHTKKQEQGWPKGVEKAGRWARERTQIAGLLYTNCLLEYTPSVHHLQHRVPKLLIR